MARLTAIGEPINDGERTALRVLRDGLPEDWLVVANFSFRQGGRTFECDALAAGPDGWAYLVEVKAWTGHIRGNDAQWELPSLVGDQPTYRTCPLDLLEQKAKALKSLLAEEDSPLKGVHIAPLIVLVSDDQPDLQGRCADATVLIKEAVAQVAEDPRPYKRRFPTDALQRISTILTKTSARIAPDRIAGNWQLDELVESGPWWDVWSARPSLGGEHSRLFRLKRYRLDPLLTGTQRDDQRIRARRDLEALERLAGADGAVPPVNAPEEDGDYWIVVTDWPDGESLASLMARGLSTYEAEEVLVALVSAVASVHRAGIVHRHLTPDCAHYLRDGRVVLTDFDYARVATAGSITRLLADEMTSPFIAPEVARDPSSTSKAADVWSLCRIAAALFGGEDASVAPDHLQRIIREGLADDPGSRPLDAEILLAVLHDESPAEFDGFQPNDEIDDQWVVQSALVEGGLAWVYKVFDTMVERDYAAKFVKPEYQGIIDPAVEYQRLFEIPDHEGIVKPERPHQMSRYRREGIQREHKAVFVPTRWVEGTRLDVLLREKLPTERCIELTLGIADAVAHLHDHGLLHRDLKPQNVIVEQATGKPVVVDFNVSQQESLAGFTKTGTEPYRPPDLGQAQWNKSDDAYSLGVVLSELLAGAPLRPTCRPWLVSSAIPEPLKLLLLRATAERADERFRDARALAEELRTVAAALAAARAHVDATPFPEASEDELSRRDWNPYQSRLIGLFSQSRTSNAGTRGLDSFGRWAYVETLIDRQLYGDVVAGRHSLVVITGNAGDGKTAFIQVLEQRLEAQGADVLRRTDGNGAAIELDGRRFVTNWDGSQDEGDVTNNDVLDEFFAPFAGPEPKPSGEETRLIAINEGRLLDFLGHRRDSYPWFADAMLELFEKETPASADWLAVVNLNLRALTIRGDDGGSLVAQLLQRFADERLWEPCKGCSAAPHCYARGNAEALRHPVIGARMAERLRETLEVARLRRRVHITMRDLRSALAFAVAGNRTCDEIVRLVEDNEGKALLAGQLYNAIFAGGSHAAGLGPDAASQDRLLALLGSLDVGATADPGDDARLWTLGTAAIRPDPPELSRGDRPLLDELRERLPAGSERQSDRQTRLDMRFLHASLRRKLYFEREEPAWLAMLPYERLARFVAQLSGKADGGRDEVVRAISFSEGLFNPAFANLLAVRLADSGAAARTFVVHPADKFELEPLDRSAAAQYVEYAPDSLRLRHRHKPGLELELDLDLYETLMRILDGYTPSREELRGAWLNLRIFKEHLATLGADSLLLTPDDRHYFAISEAEDGAVAVTPESV